MLQQVPSAGDYILCYDAFISETFALFIRQKHGKKFRENHSGCAKQTLPMMSAIEFREAF